ncbi:hypothetical protein, partial [Kingella denitrificans]
CTPCGSPPCLIFILVHYKRQKAACTFETKVQAAFLSAIQPFQQPKSAEPFAKTDTRTTFCCTTSTKLTNKC